jgi:phage terminase large subunit-like protein
LARRVDRNAVTPEERAIRFIERSLVHTKGAFAGKPFTLTDWQKRDIVSPVFGTLRPDGTRQFRTVFVEMPRKNGKSQIAAAIALVLLFADYEPGAEIYSAAADKDQARLVFGEAKRMLEGSPVLHDKAQVFKDAIEVPATGSVYKALSADAPTKHGLNPHGVLVDELHAHKNRDLWDVLTTAQGTRRQPLTFAITTAGVFDRTNICFQLHEYARDVRNGIKADPSFLGVFYGAADDADWTDPKVWRAANPALGDFLSEQFLQNEFAQAKELPQRQNTFRQLYLNQWVQQTTRWIPLEQWDANHVHPIDEREFAGRTCDGGLDLGSVSDLSAWILLFECDDDPQALDVLARFWVPEAALTNPRNPNRQLYQQWVDQKYLETTPGNVTDYNFVQAQILKDAESFQLRSLAIDRLFQGQQLSLNLQDEGLEVFPLGQGFLGQGPPMKEFERRWMAKQMHHGAHPILRWMADNVEVKADADGNIKLVKPNHAMDPRKIDGIAAMVNAVDALMREQATPEPKYQMVILGGR